MAALSPMAIPNHRVWHLLDTSWQVCPGVYDYMKRRWTCSEEKPLHMHSHRNYLAIIITLVAIIGGFVMYGAQNIWIRRLY